MSTFKDDEYKNIVISLAKSGDTSAIYNLIRVIVSLVIEIYSSYYQM